MAIYMIFRSDDRETLLTVVRAGSNTHAREIAAAMLPGYSEADLMAVKQSAVNQSVICKHEETHYSGLGIWQCLTCGASRS